MSRLSRHVARRTYPTVLELVGATPIVRLDRLGRDVPGELLAKLEFLNPGGSVKDRIGLAMIEAAERDGRLKPGGTIVEPTSGNTGVGLAMAAALRGYRTIFVMPDKMSQEKISMLRAYGAEVVITPTAVDPHSPESYYSVSDRLAEEIPGGFKPDQYSNPSNPQAHYETTGPELWEQTDGGDVDALVISVGTGGTITGVGRYFKDQGSRARIVGVRDSTFASPAEAGQVLAESPLCQRCVVKQFFRYALGRHETDSDGPAIDRALERFRHSGFHFRELILAVVTSEPFLQDASHAN